MRCKICNGESFIIKHIHPDTGEELVDKDDPTGVDTAFPCTCRLEKDERDILKSKLIGASVPISYWDFTYDGYLKKSMLALDHNIYQKNIKNLDLYKDYLANPKLFLDSYRVLWIHGDDDNSGHTVLAVLLIKELLKLKYKVRFIKMNDLLNIFTDFERKQNKLEELNSVDIYLLDDAFDVTKCIASGEYTKIHMFNWLDSVLSSGKHLVCTSNVPIQDINTTFGHCKNILLRSSTQLKLSGCLV